MTKFTAPDNYIPALSVYETQLAIGKIKRVFEDKLSHALNLYRVSAPLFVEPQSGLNDDLNGVEQPVEFNIKATGQTAQIIHSLAKWKRMALHKYKFPIGRGIYTDMNAVRQDEIPDKFHSVYVDQWDWEKVINEAARNIGTLKNTAKLIVNAICDTADTIKKEYPALKTVLSRNLQFITTQELEDMYPELTPKQREDVYLKECKSAFIMQIGDTLKSGEKHDGRAPDYDDWSLNGDIVFWSEIHNCALEVSSMGIRVDAQSLNEQLTKSGCSTRRSLPFHKMLLSGELPLTIGGGIGQSRLCMLLLEKAHIGEVQVSLWDSTEIENCRIAGIELL